MNSTLASVPRTAIQAKSSLRAAWLLWAGAAALSAPLGVLLHETGHLLAALLFGFPEPLLRFASVTHGGAEAGAPLWQQGAVAAAGPLVTCSIVLACCLAAARSGAGPWAVGPAVAAGLRTVVLGTAFLAIRIRHPGAEGNFDELNAARAFGFPAGPVVASAVLLVVTAWAFLILRIPAAARLRAVTAVLLGSGAGLAIYLGWIGPRILP